MRGTVWITYPVARVLGDTAMAQRPIPVHAHSFQMAKCAGEIVVSGMYMMDLDEDAIAHELFKCILFMLPEDEPAIDHGDLLLHFDGRTFAHGACDTTNFISDEALFRREHSILS